MAGIVGDGAMLFDGSTGYIDLNGNAELQPLSKPFSVEAWVQTGATTLDPVWNARMIFRSRTYGFGFAMGVGFKPNFNAWVDGADLSVTGPTAINDGKWHYLVGTWSRTTLSLFVDGKLAASRPATGTSIYYGGSGLGIGRDADFNASYWQGTIDEVAVYETALSAYQVQRHFLLGNNGPRGGPLTVVQAPTGRNGAMQQCVCAQRQVARPVNTANGNFWHSFTDLTTPGRGMPLNVTRTYNAQLAGTDGPFGYGWSFPYSMSFAQTAADATITEESGSQVSFTRNGSTYTPSAPRFAATLVDNGNGTATYTRLGREIFTFDSATGQLLSETDANGQGATAPYATTFTYSGGKLTTVADAAGRTYTFGWTGNHITSLTDSSTPPRAITYGYDGNGNLTDVWGVNTVRAPTVQDNDHTVFTYDTQHRVVTMRMPKFFGSTITPTPVTTNVYDSANRVTSQTDELGRETLFDYTSIPFATKITDPKGNVTVETYLGGMLTERTEGYGTSIAATWRYLYDLDTVGVIETIDPNGNSTRATYDANGNRLTTTDALGHTTSYTYNARNRVTSITEPLVFGSTPVATTFAYDEPAHSSGGADNLTSMSTPLLNGSGATVATRTIVYNHGDAARPGDVTSVIDPDGNTTTFTYDAYGNRVSQRLPATAENSSGNETRWSFDTTKGWRTAEISPRGVLAGTPATCVPPAVGCTRYVHDAWGHVTSVTDPLGNVTSTTYDANGNLASTTDAETNATTYQFDAANQLIRVDRADGTHVDTSYWPDGSVHVQYDGAGAATTYAYDARGPALHGHRSR